MPDRQGNMTTVERKVLREVIRDDYRILENQVSQELNEWEAKQIQDIQNKYAKKCDDAKAKYRKLLEKAQKLRAEEVELRRTLTEDGVDLSGAHSILERIYEVPPLSLTEEKKEIESIRNEVRLFRGRLANDLFLKQHTLWKQVALETLNSERAKELVQNVPVVGDVMKELTAATEKK